MSVEPLLIVMFAAAFLFYAHALRSFRRERLSLESLAVCTGFFLWAVLVGLASILRSGLLFMCSLLSMLVTAVLFIVFRGEMLRDAYSVEVSPDEPLRLRWLLALNSSFWLWLAYRRGPRLAAALNALSTYLIVVGTVAVLTRFVDVAFPVGLFAGVYALIALLQFRDVYGELCRKMKNAE